MSAKAKKDSRTLKRPPALIPESKILYLTIPEHLAQQRMDKAIAMLAAVHAFRIIIIS